MSWNALFLILIIAERGIILGIVGYGIEQESGVKPPQSESLRAPFIAK